MLGHVTSSYYSACLQRSIALAVVKGGHQRYLGNIEAAASQAGVTEGNGILGHIFGSKDVSRNVAAHASSASGP